MNNKKLCLIFFVSIIIFAVISCVNTPANNEALQEEADTRGLPAPPGLRWFQSENNAVLIEEGVFINGVEWATHNVNRDGTFVERPEDSGWTYQWNSIRAEFSMGQSTAGLLPASFFTNYPAGSSWEKEKDPSPPGWRVPTMEEVSSLLDTSKVLNEWVTQNGVAGRRFTDRSSGQSIFIPAGGRWYANLDAGERNLRKIDIGTSGHYWTSTADGNYGAAAFEFNSGSASLTASHRVMTNMIRPVADSSE